MLSNFTVPRPLRAHTVGLIMMGKLKVLYTYWISSIDFKSRILGRYSLGKCLRIAYLLSSFKVYGLTLSPRIQMAMKRAKKIPTRDFQLRLGRSAAMRSGKPIVLSVPAKYPTILSTLLAPRRGAEGCRESSTLPILSLHKIKSSILMEEIISR